MRIASLLYVLNLVIGLIGYKSFIYKMGLEKAISIKFYK